MPIDFPQTLSQPVSSANLQNAPRVVVQLPISLNRSWFFKSLFNLAALQVWTALPLFCLLFKVQLSYYLLCKALPNSSPCPQSLLSLCPHISLLETPSVYRTVVWLLVFTHVFSPRMRSTRRRHRIFHPQISALCLAQSLCFIHGIEWINDLFFLDLWASDKGTYICEAENQFGKIQSQTTVTVTGLGKTN